MQIKGGNMKNEELQMNTSPDILDETNKSKYEKPLIIEKSGLEFVEQILQQFQTNDLVITCTRCHHCR